VLGALAIVAAGCGGSAQPATTGQTTTPARVTVTRIGSLPQAISRASAVALPRGKLMILGGLVGNNSIDTILVGAPGSLRVVGHLPQPTHDAAAALLGSSVYFFGGGAATSTPTVVRVSLSGTAANAGTLIEPLSDLGAAVVGGKAYLVGGYTGTQFANAVLRYAPATDTVVARLPQELRYAGVAALGGTIYVAGGLSTSGPTRTVYAVTPGKQPRVVATLPKAEDSAALAALNGTLYYVGGRKILATNPRSGKVTVAARLPVSLSNATATTVGNEIVIAGGGTNGIWAFTP
jgi:kelch-like protein 24/35